MYPGSAQETLRRRLRTACIRCSFLYNYFLVDQYDFVLSTLRVMDGHRKGSLERVGTRHRRQAADHNTRHARSSFAYDGFTAFDPEGSRKKKIKMEDWTF